jgi:hypothetical protein
MVCLLSLGPSRLVALMAADRVSAARTPAQFHAMRRCDGMARLDRLVDHAPAGDCPANAPIASASVAILTAEQAKAAKPRSCRAARGSPAATASPRGERAG